MADNVENQPEQIVEENQVSDSWQAYIAHHPFATGCMPTPPLSIHHDLLDPPGVPSIGLSVCCAALKNGLLRERWDVDKDALAFLASVLATPDDEFAACWFGYGDLKVVEPVLSCDAEVDMSIVRGRNAARVSTDGLRPFETDVERGESWMWPEQELRLPAEKDDQVQAARLEVDREVMTYLHEIVQSSRAGDCEGMVCANDGCEIVSPAPNSKSYHD